MTKKKIAMFVYNNCKSDARVLKEAKSLGKGGFDVTIYALKNDDVSWKEQKENFSIVRLNKLPFHYKLFRVIRNIILSLILFIIKINRGIYRMLYSFGFKNIQPIENKLENIIKQLTHKNTRDSFNKIIKITLHNSFLILGIFIIILPLLILPIFLVLPFFFIGYLVNIFFAKYIMFIHRVLCIYDFHKRCIKECRNIPYDYFHGHDLYTLPTAATLAKIKNGKAVYDSHELFTEIASFINIEKRFYSFIEKKYFPQVAASITVNETIAKELSKRYNVNQPNVVMNCPPRIKDETSHTENVLLNSVGIKKTSKFVILYQGGYSPGRGLENLMLANEFLAENTIMLFMGWGLLESKLKAIAKENKWLNNKVFFTEPVTQDLLLHYTKCADVGVIPYQFVGLNNYYCSPNKLFEYINAHITIAASDFPELKKVIYHYEIGTTFDPENPKDIANAINKMIIDKNTIEGMKKNTYAAAEIFNWENEEKKLINLYKAL